MLARLRSFSFEDVNPIVAGIVGALLLTTVVVLALSVGVLGLLTDRYEVTAVFDDTGGIRVGSKVRVAGVNVGEVAGIHPDFERGRVVVSMEVDRGIDLGQETRARIGIDTLLGGFNIRLEGPAEEPFLADLSAEERRIPFERTERMISVVEGIDAVTQVIEEVDTTALDRFVGLVADIAIDNDEAIGELLDNVDALASVFVTREDQLRDLLEHTRTVAATVADRDQQLVQLIDTADVFLQLLDRRSDELRTILGDGSAVADGLADLIADHRQELDGILGDLTHVLAATDRRRGDLNALLTYLGPSFEGLASATTQGQFFDFVFWQVGPLHAGLVPIGGDE